MSVRYHTRLCRSSVHIGSRSQNIGSLESRRTTLGIIDDGRTKQKQRGVAAARRFGPNTRLAPSLSIQLGAHFVLTVTAPNTAQSCLHIITMFRSNISSSLRTVHASIHLLAESTAAQWHAAVLFCAWSAAVAAALRLYLHSCRSHIITVPQPEVPTNLWGMYCALQLRHSPYIESHGRSINVGIWLRGVT